MQSHMTMYPAQEHHYRSTTMDQRLRTSTPAISHIPVHSPPMAFPSSMAHLDALDSLNHSQAPADFQWSHCDVKTHGTNATYTGSPAPSQYYSRLSLPENMMLQSSTMSDSRHWHPPMVPDPTISSRWTAAPISSHSICPLPSSSLWPHTPDFNPMSKLDPYEVRNVFHRVCRLF